MTVSMQDLAYKVRALLDEYTDDGVIVSDADVADINAKIIKFSDMAFKELYALSRNEKSFEFSNKPFTNLLSAGNNFAQIDMEGVDKVYPETGNGVVGAKAYYFESTGVGTATIEEYNGVIWNVLETISMPLGTSYEAYKGTIAATNSAFPIQIRFSGPTWFRHTNRCLFSTPFAVTQVPDFRPWIPVTMPTDFMDISQIITEYPERQYSTDVPYKWEAPNRLYINYYFDGSYRAVYKPIPADVTSLSQTVDCNSVIAQAVVYYCAAKIAPYENKSVVSYFQAEYERLKLNATSPTPLTWQTVSTAYSIGW